MKQLLFRFLNMVLGLIFYSFGIVLTIQANIGYAPWDVFHVGLSNTIGLSLGVTVIFTGMAIVLTVALLGERIGIGTLGNMALMGVFLDLVFRLNIIPKAENFFVGAAMLIIGLLIISVGTYYYMKSALGAGPRDNLMVVLTRKTKLPVGLCRIIVEILATGIGWALGGMVGIGTVISAFGIGFCIQLTFRVFKFDAAAIKHETLYDTYKYLFKKEKTEPEKEAAPEAKPEQEEEVISEQG